MPNAYDCQFIQALGECEGARPSGRGHLNRVFRLAYLVLGPARSAALRCHGRASAEDAAQNTLREFLEKLRAGGIVAERAPGLLRVMYWRRLLDERRRVAKLRFGLDLDAEI